MKKAINVLSKAIFDAKHTRAFYKKCLRRKKLHNEQYMTKELVKQKRKEYAEGIVDETEIIKECKKAIKILTNLK